MEKVSELESVTVDLGECLAACNRDLPQPEQHNYVVTRDSIRHIAYATEEYNAIYLDEEYAKQTRWGGIIAPPGYLYSHGQQFFAWPVVGHGLKIVDSEGLEFDGADNMADDWDFYLPVRPGDTIISHTKLVDATVKRGPRAGIFVLVSVETRFVNQRGELVARLRSSTARWSRQRQHQLGGMAASYPMMPPGQLTRSPNAPTLQLHYPPQIPRRYDRHNVYFDDVQEEMEIPELVIGPLSTGQTRRWEMYITNMCRPDSGGHAGDIVPDFYAAGVMRVPWFGRMLTMWTGPNAWIRRLSYQNREWVLVGYKYFCRGKVVRKYVEEGRHYVDCELRIENELGRMTNTGSAVLEVLALDETKPLRRP